MKIKHLVFDWDGTLADTYPVISAAYEHTFKTLGIKPVSYNEIKRQTSLLPNKDTLGYFFGSQKEEAKKTYYDYINTHHISGLKAISGATELLTYAAKHNFAIYLITNKKRPYLLAEADKLGFTDFFNNIVAAGDFAEDKPHPVATHAVFKNDLPPADSILVIGDGLADWHVARSYDHSGAKALFALYDNHSAYQGDHPDYRVTDLNEIISILKANQ